MEGAQSFKFEVKTLPGNGTLNSTVMVAQTRRLRACGPETAHLELTVSHHDAGWTRGQVSSLTPTTTCAIATSIQSNASEPPWRVRWPLRKRAPPSWRESWREP